MPSYAHLRPYLNLIHPELRPLACIAGSAAVLPENYPDVDVWVLGGVTETDAIQALKTQILEFLNGNGIFYLDAETWKYPEADFYQICVVPSYLPPAQIMVTPYETISQLLNNFDLSCHAHAVSFDGPEDCVGQLYNLPGVSTYPFQDFIKVIKKTTPHSTLKRYFKFAERYHTKVLWSEVEELCEAVAKAAVSRHMVSEPTDRLLF